MSRFPVGSSSDHSGTCSRRDRLCQIQGSSLLDILISPRTPPHIEAKEARCVAAVCHLNDGRGPIVEEDLKG